MTRYECLYVGRVILTLYNFQLQPNLERQLDQIYFLFDNSCELGQLLTRYDLLYGIYE